MDEKMTSAERTMYESAYEQAGTGPRLAELFYDVRTDAGPTQTELARRMGTSQPLIARIEGGDSDPDHRHAQAARPTDWPPVQITLPFASWSWCLYFADTFRLRRDKRQIVTAI
jgi:transcriptional regulator with XRE-family HTH domain